MIPGHTEGAETTPTHCRDGRVQMNSRYQAKQTPIGLGIDLGGTEIKALTLAPDGRILWSRRMATGAAEGREAVLVRLVELIVCAVRSSHPGSIRSLGVAFPGVLDMATGRVEKIANLTPDWNGFSLRDELETRAGLPVFLLNDVRAATVAEQTWGAGRGYRDFICIAIGTGIGGGLVLDGRLYLGSRGAAGELGHQTVLPDGPLCGCGNKGCLETVASGPAIMRAGRAAIEAGDGELAALIGSIEPTPQDMANAAAKGSVTAESIFARAGEWIGLALGNLVCALNPEAIVVGGGVAEAGELLLRPIRREIERRTIVFSRERGGVEVLQSPLGPRAGAMGAAAWAMQRSAGKEGS
jgi:glucokinase